MGTTGKMSYTQADNALAVTAVEYKFSKNGTNQIFPTSIDVICEKGQGSKLVYVAVNTTLTCAIIKSGESKTFKDALGRPIKTFYLSCDAAGAPDYRAEGNA